MLCLSLILGVALPLLHIPSVQAIANTQAATTVLGQTDGEVIAPLPIFIKGAVNNAAHKLGLSGPYNGIALDATDHRLFLTDTTNNRILVYALDSNNTLIDRIPDNVLGQMNFWYNVAVNTQMGLNVPYGLAFDDTRNFLFVAEATGNRVKVFDVTGITDGENAINVLGQATFAGTTAATTQEGMNAPLGLAFDSVSNRLFVSQYTGNRVTVYDVEEIADGEAATHVLGQANFITATAATTQVGMNVPYGVAYHEATGRLFVAQATGNRVTVYSGSVALIGTGMPATKVLGQANFTATAAATTQAGMNVPVGIAYNDASNLLFVSQTTGNRVTVYSGSVALLSNGMNATQVLGQANFTTTTAANTQAGMSAPNGVLVDAANSRVYVPQSGNHRVTIFNVTDLGRGENAEDALGQYNNSLLSPSPIYTKSVANNGPNSAGLNAPQGVVVDPVNHRIFVADSTNNRILVYNADANNTPLDLVADNVLGQLNFYVNAVATTQIGLSSPTGLAFDQSRNLLFAADLTNCRIVVYDTASITDGEAAINVLGQVNFTTATAGITQLGLSSPRQIEYDGTTQQLFVADTGNHRIVIYDLAIITDGECAVSAIGQTDASLTAPQPIFIKGIANDGPHKLGLSAPVLGIVIDSTDHRLFVSDAANNRVLVYNLDASNNLLDRIPDNVLGQTTFWNNAAAATRAGTYAPYGLAYDHNNKRLFVAQITSNRVSVFDVATITDGEDAANILGQVTYAATTASVSQVRMNVPTGVAYDHANNRLFVTDSTNNRVLAYNLAAGLADYMNANSALGQYDNSVLAPAPIFTKSVAHNGPNKFGFNAPVIGIALDRSGHRLFVSDTSNNRVLIYNLDNSNSLLDRVPDNVLGQLNFFSNAAASTQTGFETPNGLALSGSTLLFVAEGAGSRVKVFDVTSVTDGENAINVLGQATFIGTTAATTQVGMSAPADVLYHSATQRLFVSDPTLNRVTVYSGSLSLLSNGLAATKVLGQTNFISATAATTQVGMNVPYGLSYDEATNRLFVAEGTSNRVLVYSGSVALLSNGMNATKVLGQANFTTATPASTQVGMNVPRGITYDSARNLLYVAQTVGNRVTVYSGSVALLSNGMNATQVLGQTNFTTATVGNTQAGMNTPTGVAIDETNNRLYVPQSGSNRITTYDLSTFVRGENAEDVLGQYDDSLVAPSPIFTKINANNGPNILGLSAPVIGIALDPTDHRLFVSDTGNNRVLAYDLDSNDVPIDRIPDHVLGQSNYYSNAAATTQIGMNVPNGIAYDDATDRLFVAQGTGNRVTVYSGSVALLSDGMAATKVLGQANFTATTAATTQVGMNIPYDVVYHGATDRLFVSQGTGNRVTVYSGSVALLSNGMNATKVLGQTNFTNTAVATTQAGMSGPRGLAYDATRDWLFVSETTNNRVTVFSGSVALLSNGMNASQVLGQTTFTVGTLGSTQAGMNDPRGIAYDEINQRLFVSQATGNRVTIYNLADIARGENAINVLGQPDFTTITAGILQEGLNAPTGVLSDPVHNRLYVLDSTANRVLSFTLTLGIGTGKPASAVLGQTGFGTRTAGTTQSTLSGPYDAAFNSATDRLFISDSTNNRILVFSGSTSLLSTGMNASKVIGQTTFALATAATTQAGLNAPRGIAYDDTHDMLYVAQSGGNRVSVFSGSVALFQSFTLSATKVLGQPNFIVGTAGNRQSGLNLPYGIFIDDANYRLYVLQNGSSRVSIFDVTNIANGENATDLLGQHDDNLSTPGPLYLKGTANNASHKLGLSGPQGLALDTVNNRLFVADSANNRILVYNLTAGHLPEDLIADKVLGQFSFWNNAVNTTQWGLSSPTGLAFDPTGNMLFAADFTNNRIVAYDTATITDGEFAVAVLGQPSYIVATLGITQVGLNGPRQIFYDKTTGKLFVADATSSRVVIYDVNHANDGTTGDSFNFFGF